MFKNKIQDGKCNRCGVKIRQLRTQKSPKMSQRSLAQQLALFHIHMDKNAIQRIESGQRFVTDIELAAFARIFGVSCDELVK